jgi:TrmH family RNA methyltransferase
VSVERTDGPITSVRNPRVRAVAALADADARRSSGRHLAEGPRVVLEALASATVDDVLVADDVEVPADLARAIAAAGARRTPVGRRVLERVATTVHPTGPVAVVVTPDVAAPLPAHGALLVLDGIADPGNVGTLVRAADAFGAAGVVVIDGADPFSPKAVRASAGSCYHLPLRVRRDRVAAVAELAAGRELHGLAADAGTSVTAARLPADVALVVGHEARGIDAVTRGALTGLLRVPMPGRAESLNAATAGSIALFAVLVGAAGGRLGSPGPAEEAS